MASITSATSGPSNVGSTWVGGVVPVVGDQVTIAHPGTTNLASTLQHVTDAAGYAVGATNIVVTTGAGSIVAGECVQFGSDPVYYKVATGVSPVGTIVLAAPGLITAIPAAVTSVTNRGHVVELVATHTWGHDVSSLTPATNSIVVLGTLKASRSVSSSLTARGTIFRGQGGTIDLGATGVDIIPSGVTATIILNDSATLAAGKHGCTNTGQVGTTFRAAGVVRTRNTRLTSGISAGATSITVDASDNWAIGDRIVLASDTDDATRAQVVTISGGSSPTWTVPAITNARLAGCRVGNLSSNVTIKSMSAAHPSFVTDFPLNVATRDVCLISDVRFEDMGSNSSWVSLAAGSPIYSSALNIAGASATKAQIIRPAFETTNNAGVRSISFGPATLERHAVSDAAIYILANSGPIAIQMHSAASADIDAHVYKSDVACLSNNSDGSATCVLSGFFHGNAASLQYGPALRMTVNDSELRSVSQSVIAGSGSATVNNSIVSSVGRLVAATNVGHSGVTTFNSCTFAGAALSGNVTQGNKPSQAQKCVLVAVNEVASDNRVISYHQTTVTDTTTRKRSTYAVKIQPKVASTPITYTFTLPAVAGVAQTIKGSLRFDATYGTATPPRIDLSGQGVTQSHTCAATADAWDDFSFTFTPTSTGDITATVTVQSASTSGFAWLDGVYHYPMIQSVRHYGYLWQPQAAQVADGSITVSEATALAYPVSVNHGTSTITVSGNATSRQVYEALMADLCATANIGQAKHVSTTDGGASFSTTYNVTIDTGVTVTGNFTTTGAVTLTGTADVAGVYTNSSGVHVKITAPNLIAGTRVQLYDVAGATELLNTTLSGTGLSHRLVWTTDKTIRLRATYTSGTSAKHPIESSGVLASTGLAFIDTQADDTIYNAIGVDGSTCTEFAADYPNLQIDVSDGDGTTSVQRIYSWACYAQTTSQGIALMFNAVDASDTANFVIDQSVVNAKLDNVGTGPVIIGGGYIRRLDGTSVIAATSGSIQMDPGKAYVAADIATDVQSLALVHGLIAGSPLEVTATTRTAGAVSQTIATVSGTTTVSRV